MRYWIAIIVALASDPALAQHAGHESGKAHSPYAGLTERAVKALSAEQIADLRAGRGMSLALPAELNGYPGPSHALELADRIGLTQAQRQRTEELFATMKAQATRLGEELVAAETELDRLFREGRATSLSVAAATEKAASIQGRLRASHLDAHLAMKTLLTADQAEAYDRARGYRRP
jgi:Spy/CpxP family protein refolding chaperone